MLEFHPIANLFPLIEGSEFDRLVEDVRENGLQERIVLLNGQILDGRNRYRALEALGKFSQIAHTIDFGHLAFTQAAPRDPLAWVLSKNLHRRHLSESQRALVAARLETYQHGGKRTGGGAGEGREAADGGKEEAKDAVESGEELDAAGAGGGAGEGREAADGGEQNAPDQDANLHLDRSGVSDLMHVSPRSVASAKAVSEKAIPELVAKVERGDMRVSAAEVLSSLSPDDQRAAIANADPKALNAVVKDLRAKKQAEKKARRTEREAELATKQRALPEKRYGVIYADPEWRFEPYSRDTGMDRAPENHYPTSELADIKAREVAAIAADDCVLFLWATAPMLPHALEVMAAWGFVYKSHTVWRKAELEPGATLEQARRDRGGGTANLMLGPGYWFRNAHELLLVGTRGKMVAPTMGEQFPSVIDAPAARHSEKPERFAELIAAYFPNLPKIELNARAARPGWEVWGLEAPESEDTDGAREETGTSSTDAPSPGQSIESSDDAASANAGGDHDLSETQSPLSDAAGASAPAEQDANSLIRVGYANNRPLAEIAAQTGLTPNVIKGRARRMGLSSRDRQRAAVARANAKRGQE